MASQNKGKKKGQKRKQKALPRPRLTLLIGMSGAGKSTFVRMLTGQDAYQGTAQGDWFVVSRDAEVAKGQKKATDHCHSLVSKGIKKGMCVVVDMANLCLTRRGRREWMESAAVGPFAGGAHKHTHMVFFDVSAEECHRRVVERVGHTNCGGGKAIRSQHKMMEPPQASTEGIPPHNIHVISSTQERDALLLKWGAVAMEGASALSTESTLPSASAAASPSPPSSPSPSSPPPPPPSSIGFGRQTSWYFGEGASTNPDIEKAMPDDDDPRVTMLKPWTPRPGKPACKVFCDMDGVLCDFEAGVRRLSGGRSTHDLGKQMWKLIEQEEFFFRDLPFMPGARELWALLRRLEEIGDVELWLLTAVPVGRLGRRAHEQKPIWASRELGLPATRVITCMKDQKARQSGPNRILIDDRAAAGVSWREKGGVFVHHTDAEMTIEQLRIHFGRFDVEKEVDEESEGEGGDES